MSRKLVLILVFLMLLVCLGYPRFQRNIVTASDGYPVHNLNTGLNYTSIQEAIAANETLNGHTILVDGGTYFENLVISKTLSLVGESRETVIVDGENQGTVVNVTADRVVLTRFTIKNSGVGVLLYAVSFPNITDNIIEQSGFGIMLDSSSNSTISLNQIVDNTSHGIVVDSSQDNTIEQNNLARDDAEAINLWQSTRNYIHNNTILDCKGAIWMGQSDNNVFSNNSIRNCTVSYLHVIAEANSRGNWIEGNTVDSYIRPSMGITLYDCNESTIVGNTIKNCQYGIYLASGRSNVIYHNNVVNCTTAAYIFSGPSLSNVWDDGLEGNYWSDYNGTDSNQDGVGDTPYVIDANNGDNCPLRGTFQSFNVPAWNIGTNVFAEVDVISNSTIHQVHLADFLLQPPCRGLGLIAHGEDGTNGFCRITFPNSLFNSTTYPVLIALYNQTTSRIIQANGTHTTLYFAYNQTLSVFDIVILPEFPSYLVLPLFMIATTLAIIVYKRKHLT